ASSRRSGRCSTASPHRASCRAQAHSAQGTQPARTVAAFSRTGEIRFGAAVYGSFLVGSVVGVAYEADDSVATLTGSVLGSMVIFWVAHTWSDVIGERIAVGSRFRRRDVLVVARREWPLFEAALLPALLLALAWAGVWSRDTGAVLALAAAIMQITGW